MCGIAGIVQFKPLLERGEIRTVLQNSMAKAIAHRGPDGEGVWVNESGSIGFAHRRLSIIDLSDAGAQPMWSHDGRYCITFNGEIYNYLELRDELAGRGAKFITQTDTEVILEAYRAYGAGMLERFDGMYAFAIYDVRDEAVFMARDPFGEKPLYYTCNQARLAFASELGALRCLRDFDDTILPDELAKYLCLQYFDGEATPYRGAKKLKPGHWMLLQAGKPPRMQRYFEFEPNPQPSGRSIDDWADELEDILVTNLKRRLRADVPVGAFLSAGVDSSTVVALAARRLGINLDTFSIGFSGYPGSEHAQAAEIAAHLGVPHHIKMVSPDDLGLAKDIGSFVDEPNGDGSLLPTYLISEFARRRVKVVLSGDGADELFGGYGRYMQTLAEENLPVRSELGAGARYYSNRVLVWSEKEVNDIMAGWRPALAQYMESLRQEVAEVATGRLLASLRKTDVEHYLPGAVLAKVDRMSMRHGLEVRTPFLNLAMARFAERLPDRILVNGDSGKLVLKQLAARYLPRSWLDRPKRGFGWPAYQWPGSRLEDQLGLRMISARDRTTWWVNRVGIRKWLDDVIKNKDTAGYKLWVLLHLQIYLESKGGKPLQEIDLLSCTELPRILKKDSSPVLGLCIRSLPYWKSICPVDQIVPLYGDAHEKDWIKAPADIVRSVSNELGKQIRTVVLFDRGGVDNDMLDSLFSVGVRMLLQHIDGQWRKIALPHGEDGHHPYVIPLVYSQYDERFYRFDKKRVLRDLYRRLPLVSAAIGVSEVEHDSDWLLSNNAGLLSKDTPRRAYRLLKELQMWGVSSWNEQRNMAGLLRYARKPSHQMRKNGKRIALLIGCLGAGGSERQICNLAGGLKQAGFLVRVYTLFPLYGGAAHYGSLLEALDIEVVSIAGAAGDVAEQVVMSPEITQVLQLLGRLPRYIRGEVWPLYLHFKEWGPDVLISFLDRPNLIGGLAALLAQIPKIMASFRAHSPDNFSFHEDWYHRYYRLLIASGRVKFVGNSMAGNYSYAKWLGLDVGSIALIRNGIDFSSLQTVSKEEILDIKERHALFGSKIVLGVFRLSHEKRPELFVRTVEEVLRKTDNLKALVVGDGPVKQQLQRFIEQRGLQDRVFLVGRKNNVAAYFEVADVILHTAEIEGTPNTLLEAQYFNKPVVTTHAGGAAEAVSHGVSAYVLTTDNPAELADAVARLLLQPDLAHEMGRSGKKFVQERYSMHKMVDGFVRLFDGESMPAIEQSSQCSI